MTNAPTWAVFNFSQRSSTSNSIKEIKLRFHDNSKNIDYKFLFVYTWLLMKLIWMQNIQHKTQISPKVQLLRKKRNKKYKKTHSTSGKINWTKPTHRRERLYSIWRAAAVTWWRSLQNAKRTQNECGKQSIIQNPRVLTPVLSSTPIPLFYPRGADLSP